MRTQLLLPLAIACAIGASPAFSDPLGVRVGSEEYQRELIESALTQHGLEIDPSPEGKKIDNVVVVPYDVVVSRDPWPDWLNLFHWKTDADVVERELLFSRGEKWNADLVDESERNLRSYLFVAVARIIAVRAPGAAAGDGVTALVVTKDLWSLRLNTDFSFVGSVLETLSVQLEERNLGGRNRDATVSYAQDLASWTLGGTYTEPWLLGERLALTGSAAVIINRASQATEGGVGSLSVGKPLYSLETDWAWNAGVTWRRDVARLFSGASLASYEASTGELVPYEFGRDQVTAVAEVIRSYGRENKLDLSFGWRALVKSFNPGIPEVSTQALSDFEANVLPRTESAGMIFVGVHAYRNEYVRRRDVDSFAITEDYHLGPDAALELRAAAPEFGFSSTFVEPVGSAGWTWAFGGEEGDILTAGTSIDTRYQPELELPSSFVDTLFTVHLHNASPFFLGFLRFHTGLQLSERFNDLDHNVFTLGGDTNLRGYPVGFIIGEQLWTANFELRTRPVEWHTVHGGLATFVDIGDSPDAVQSPGAHGSAGLGVRLLFPQFNRAVLRADFAVPFETVPGGAAYLSATFGQAF